jgi:hypothetical protein
MNQALFAICWGGGGGETDVWLVVAVMSKCQRDRLKQSARGMQRQEV